MLRKKKKDGGTVESNSLSLATDVDKYPNPALNKNSLKNDPQVNRKDPWRGGQASRIYLLSTYKKQIFERSRKGVSQSSSWKGYAQTVWSGGRIRHRIHVREAPGHRGEGSCGLASIRRRA
ncbi:hypothetical protein MPTK1_6g04230 [Marchantia polymorpha subsp. ruderalis]|uniref:Uncharacterized protein n=2 Tax=Marchantia polymorpha TaxID=3197 RepID=A0AAF6BNE1_MARPO|nr:hypothetical protein MARPO_0034s0097 [Marchantia polymorpha]BBN13525.1 hypothetical protein Mp_6g04230 [Marchantia polymorpha subsp. ruderalis]|eukprot:PTQ41515.1 hypothetical protein MARPO_0034s0097 [Marchantia polymorpha]